MTEMHGWSDGHVAARHDWAPGLFTLTLAAEVEPFEPGQFVNLALDLAGTIERRSYSIASPPGAPLEFLVAEVQTGVLTPSLGALEPGQKLLVERKPQGFFTLRWVPAARHLWLVATGTGLGPFLSILRSPDVYTRFERVVLVHGARDRNHLAYREELRALETARGGQLEVAWLVSREGAGEGVLAGRVTSALADGSLERAVGLPLSAADSHVMLCGNPAMIEEMTALLGERGMKKHRVRAPGHITIEKYW
jgi:ferredoxin/flavodoxin---NADP+ reductase